LQGPPKFTQIGNLGVKIHHLATLADNTRTGSKDTAQCKAAASFAFCPNLTKVYDIAFFSFAAISN
jgi:hypothetical protein